MRGDALVYVIVIRKNVNVGGVRKRASQMN